MMYCRSELNKCVLNEVEVFAFKRPSLVVELSELLYV